MSLIARHTAIVLHRPTHHAAPSQRTHHRLLPRHLRLLLKFMQRRTGRSPSRLDWADLDADAMARSSTTSKTIATTAPAPATPGSPRSDRCSPTRRCGTPSTPPRSRGCWPSRPSASTKPSSPSSTSRSAALLAAPDRSTWDGRRDHAFMALAMQTGLRVSELLGLDCGDVVLGTGAHVRCEGKGRKQRSVPLTDPVRSVIASGYRERQRHNDEPVFPTRTGRRLSLDAVQRRITAPRPSRSSTMPLTGEENS